MATEITPARANMYVEELQSKASVSEATFQKMGGAIAFVNNRQYDTHSFSFNGRYKLGQGFVGADGIFPILFNMEIMGITMFNRVAGSSGTTELDLQWFNASNSNQGSIFSTTPKIASSAAANTAIIWREIDSTDLESPTGTTVPILSKTQFDAGDFILCKINNAMTDAEDCSLLIHFRPR